MTASTPRMSNPLAATSVASRNASSPCMANSAEKSLQSLKGQQLPWAVHNLFQRLDKVFCEQVGTVHPDLGLESRSTHRFGAHQRHAEVQGLPQPGMRESEMLASPLFSRTPRKPICGRLMGASCMLENAIAATLHCFQRGQSSTIIPSKLPDGTQCQPL